MSWTDGLATGLKNALESRGLPREPAQVIGRLFCFFYIAPLTPSDNDERFKKYFTKKGFEEYASTVEQEDDPEHCLKDGVICGKITGISYDQDEFGCCLHFSPINTREGTVVLIRLNDGLNLGDKYMSTMGLVSDAEDPESVQPKDGPELPGHFTLL